MYYAENYTSIVEAIDLLNEHISNAIVSAKIPLHSESAV